MADKMKRLREHYNPAAEIATLKGRIEQADCLLSEWLRARMDDSPAAARWIIDARRILRGEGE